MNFQSRRLAAAGMIALLAGPLCAQVQIQTVAITGDAAPGFGGVMFDVIENFSFPPPATADGAFSVFPATTQFPGGGSANVGVFGGLTGQLEILYLSGGAAPGTNGALFTNGDSMMDSVIVNDQGVAAVRGFLTGGDTVNGASDIGIWAGAPGQLQLLARAGQSVPSPAGNERFASFNPPGIANAGQVVFRASTSVRWRIYAGSSLPASDGSSLRLIVSHADPAPITIPNRNDPLTLHLLGFTATGNNSRINSSGHVAFSGGIEGFSVSNAGGIFLSGSAGIQVVAHNAQNRFDNTPNAPLSPGSEAPGTGAGGRFTGVGAFEMNDLGQIAFNADYFYLAEDGGAVGGSGLWIGTPGNLQLIARTGQPSGVGSTTFDKFTTESGGGFLNDVGQVVFRSQLLGGTPGMQALFRGSAGSATPIVAQGQNAEAAGPGWKFKGFGGGGTINDAGQVAFHAFLENGSASSVQSLWLATAEGDLKIVTRVGALFQVRPGDERTVRQIFHSRIDDDGQVVVRLEFEPRVNEDFTSGIFIAGLPNPLFGKDFYWGGPTAVDDNWHTTSPRVNWEDSFGITATVPGGAGNERVFIENASVVIADAPVTIGTLTATGTLTIRNRFAVNADSTAGAIVLDQPQSRVVASGELKLGEASRWNAGIVSGGTFDGSTISGGLIIDRFDNFDDDKYKFAIGPGAAKTVLDGVLVNRGQVELTDSLALDNGIIYNDAVGDFDNRGKFTIRAEPGHPIEIASAGDSVFHNRGGELRVQPSVFDGRTGLVTLYPRYLSEGRGLLWAVPDSQLILAGGSSLSGSAEAPGSARVQGNLLLMGGPERPHVVSGEFYADGFGAMRLPADGVLQIQDGATFVNVIGREQTIADESTTGLFLQGGSVTVDGTLLNDDVSGSGFGDGPVIFRAARQAGEKISPVDGSGQFINLATAIFAYPYPEIGPNPPFGVAIINRNRGVVKQEGELIVGGNIENDGEHTKWIFTKASGNAFATHTVLRGTTDSIKFINKGTLETFRGTELSTLDLPLDNLGGTIDLFPRTSLVVSRNTTHEDGSNLEAQKLSKLSLEGDENTFGNVTISLEKDFVEEPGHVAIKGRVLRVDGLLLARGSSEREHFGGDWSIDADQILMGPFGQIENRASLTWLKGDLSGDSGILNGSAFISVGQRETRPGWLYVSGPGRKMLDGTLVNRSSVEVQPGATLLIGPGGEIHNRGTFVLAGRLVAGEDDQQVIGKIINSGRFRVPIAGSYFVKPAFDNTGSVSVGQGAFLSFKGTVEQFDFDSRTLNGGKWDADGGTLDIGGGQILINKAILAVSGAGRIINLPSVTSTGSFNNFGGLTLHRGAEIHMGGHFDNNGFVVVDSTSTLRVGSFDNWDNFLLDGIIQTFNTLTLNEGGMWEGSGTVRGDVISGGTTAPGNSPGTLTVNGNYTQLSTGKLFIELAGQTSFDRLAISGLGTFDGTLAVVLRGYLPASTDSFPVVEATQPIVGNFTNLSNGRVATADYTGSFNVMFTENNKRVVLGEFIRAPDTDSDGMSDLYEAQFGFNPSNASDSGADSDGDGEDNLAEFRAFTDPSNPSSFTRSGRTLNISTRLRVLTGNDVLIGGYIITGSTPKQVIVRALGPSLGAAGVSDTLADPTLELFDSSGSSIGFNNDWKDAQQTEIEATTIPPTSDLEAAIVQTLSPGAYTAVVSGAGGATGVSLVEVYDLSGRPAKLANISTRGFVSAGDNVMIGGFILGAGFGVDGSGSTRVVARALGPSLVTAGVLNPLQDPILELYNGNGDMIAANDNWRSDQETELEETTIAPLIDREAAVVAVIPTGAYTAVVRGVNDGAGVGLIEVYNLNP